MLRLRLKFSGCSCGLVFETVCETEVVCTELGATGRRVYYKWRSGQDGRAAGLNKSQAEMAVLSQERDADVGWREKWGAGEWGVRSGRMRSVERENEEWGAGEWGVRSGRMRSSAERWGMLEESVDDRWVGKGHRRRVRLLTLLLATADLCCAWCRRTILLPTICFVLLFLSSFFFSRLCQCKLLLASPFLFVFFLATRTWRLCWRRRV